MVEMRQKQVCYLFFFCVIFGRAAERELQQLQQQKDEELERAVEEVRQMVCIHALDFKGSVWMVGEGSGEEMKQMCTEMKHSQSDPFEGRGLTLPCVCPHRVSEHLVLPSFTDNILPLVNVYTSACLSLCTQAQELEEPRRAFQERRAAVEEAERIAAQAYEDFWKCC